MDFNEKENYIKIRRKVSSTASKIIRTRKKIATLVREEREYEEIRGILSTSGGPVFSSKDTESREPSDSPRLLRIPKSAPGILIFQEFRLFSHFNEKTLSLKDFLETNDVSSLGKEAQVPNEDIFRTLIASHAGESLLPDEDGGKHRLKRLYVLYLLSVHPDNCFVSACVEFLKYRRFKISGFEILPIYVNFGCALQSLIGSNDVLDLPIKFKTYAGAGRGGNQFPYYNMEMVVQVLLYYANLDLINKDEGLKVLVKALTRVTLDPKITSSRLLPSYSQLISLLSSQLASVYGPDDIASWLHLENEHIMNQLEVVRLVHMPISYELHELLLNKTITFILDEDISAAGDTFQARYVWTVLKKMTEKFLLPVKIYCILQLINGSLPNVTATKIEASDINTLLVNLEGRICTVQNSVDRIRLNLEAAKLRSIIINSVDKVYPEEMVRLNSNLDNGGNKKNSYDREFLENRDESSPKKKAKIEAEKCLHSQSSANPEKNKLIIEELQKLADAFAARKNTWRAYSYRKAVSALARYNKDITSFQEACAIPGVGERMALKIVEILESGKCGKVQDIVDEKTKVLELFCNIWGIGPCTAENWYHAGFRTLEDLREKAKLNKQQEIGLNFYQDFMERMTREDVERIAAVVENELKEINSRCKMELVGSYRRGKATCGDVDIMLVNPGPKYPLDILIQLTDRLRMKGYLTHDLVDLGDASPDANNHRKYLGVFKFPGDGEIHRRIDVFVVPESEYAPGLMHYTGSAMFNRSLRVLASRKGLTLNEHGLYAGIIRKGSDILNSGELVPTPTEQDIFNYLGLEYKLPEERDH